MAIDEAMLARAAAGADERPVLRVYRWASPALSVGANQEVPGEVLERCEAAGVEVVRRPTGGGAVLHVGDVTYAVVAPHGGRGVLETYRWVARGLVAAFQALGIGAAVAEHGPGGSPLACFAVPTGADLAVGGAKVCGSAQARRGGWFLQHGSIPVADIRRRTEILLGEGAGRGWTCVSLLRPGTRREEVEEALVRGFALVWGGEPEAREAAGEPPALRNPRRFV